MLLLLLTGAGLVTPPDDTRGRASGNDELRSTGGTSDYGLATASGGDASLASGGTTDE